MARNVILANRLREVLLNGHWIANTNFKEMIEGIHWTHATLLLGNHNSIAHLVYHINYYLKGLLYAFEHGKIEIKDTYSFDLPEITKEAEWKELASSLIYNASLFADKIERLNDADFDQPFLDGSYGTIYRNVEGVIEHSYYHLGQISLISKLISQKL